MTAPSYPVHVDATLDTGLSRWLWLVKWLLAIPHFLVLAFLWLAFVVLSMVAFVAILVSGRYPRPIFDFNVGVLRWSWRVAYYTWGAFGTDRYPPFTLAEVPGYPAHFEVDYPEHLSRGLVLIKWWLLAIPHYLVVALLAGSGVYIALGTTTDDGAPMVWGTGLIGLLAIIAAIALLFTGRYPEQLFDLVLGLNRWVLRVAAYAGLMTDEYPPFRLDQGGHDPVPGRVAVPAAGPSGSAGATAGGTATARTTATGETAPSTARPVTWTAGRVVTVVIGSLVFLLAGGLLASAITMAVGGAALRDDQGFVMTPAQTVSTASYAVASQPLVIDAGTDGTWPASVLGDVSLRADGGGGEIFIGLAPAADAAAFLEGVEHVTLVDAEGFDEAVYRETTGGAPSTLPGDTDIWVASASGPGTQQLTWEPTAGSWAVVAMRPDGSAGVTSAVSAGAELPVLGWLVLAAFVGGGLLLLLAIGLVLGALHGGPRTPAPASSTTAPPAFPGTSPGTGGTSPGTGGPAGPAPGGEPR